MNYPFELKKLNYEYDALEPFIDAQTMELHHSKHLNTYITNLNNALKDYPAQQSWSLVDLVKRYPEFPESLANAVRNNGGGIINHNLFFDHLAKDVPVPTSGPFYDAIVKSFNSVENMLEGLKTAGLGVFGSGWAWLVADKNNQLSIVKTPNQDVPNLEENTLILGLDVWEHAYYLKNQNRRAEYIDNFFKVIDWKKVEDNFLNR